MKRRNFLSRTALAAGALTAAMAMNTFAAAVTEETAKTIALENAGQKAEDVTFLKLKADVENDHRIFEVKFLTSDSREYDYEILESDGTILSVGYEIIAFSSHGAGTPISMEQARTVALEKAGVKAEEAVFLKEETDYDHGVPIYEAEFHTADSKKYKYEFNGNTGAMISWEYDAWRCLLTKEQPPTPGSTDTAEKADAISGIEGAKAAALKKAGLKESDVTWKKLERDREDGRLVYEGEFICGAMEYEFEIDGATGVFLDWEAESIYD